jgi:hypothetical protein
MADIRGRDRFSAHRRHCRPRLVGGLPRWRGISSGGRVALTLHVCLHRRYFSRLMWDDRHLMHFGAIHEHPRAVIKRRQPTMEQRPSGLPAALRTTHDYAMRLRLRLI